MKKGALFDAALLSVTSYLAIFLHAASFGLYEDDWPRVTATLGLSFSGLRDLTLPFLTLHAGQGRPLHDSLIYLFSFAGWKLGGVGAMYAIGYAIFAANAILFYLLLRRLAPSRAFALAGALAFCLYPADTTRAFLTHALGVQPACTFLLIACHLWISGRRALAYLAACGCLISYETFFPLFLAVPLAGAAWERWRAWLKHGFIMGAILAFDLSVRRWTGESRVAGLSLSALASSLHDAWAGPLTVLRIYIHAPRLVLQHLAQHPVELGVAFLASSVAFAALFWRRASGDGSALPRLAVFGAAMVIVSHPLALTGGAEATLGRGTRAHAPAAIGASILAGCAVAAAVERRRRLTAAAVGLVFATLLCEGLIVQHDYARAWTLQRDFWSAFAALPAADGDVYLLDQPPDTAVISAFSWSMALIPQALYQYPKSWKNAPRVFVAGQPQRARICAGEDVFASSDWVLPYKPDLAEGYRGAPLTVRRIALENGSVVWKTPLCGTAASVAASGVPAFATSPAYRALIHE